MWVGGWDGVGWGGVGGYDQLCCPASPKLLKGLYLGLGCDKWLKVNDKMEQNHRKKIQQSYLICKRAKQSLKSLEKTLKR